MFWRLAPDKGHETTSGQSQGRQESAKEETSQRKQQNGEESIQEENTDSAPPVLQVPVFVIVFLVN